MTASRSQPSISVDNPGQNLALLHRTVSITDRQKNARATVRLHRAKEGACYQGQWFRNSTYRQPARKPSGGLRQFLPVLGGEINQPTTQRLELGRTVIVLDLLRVVRHRVDETVGGEIAFDDEVP